MIGILVIALSVTVIIAVNVFRSYVSKLDEKPVAKPPDKKFTPETMAEHREKALDEQADIFLDNILEQMRNRFTPGQVFPIVWLTNWTHVPHPDNLGENFKRALVKLNNLGWHSTIIAREADSNVRSSYGILLIAEKQITPEELLTYMKTLVK